MVSKLTQEQWAEVEKLGRAGMRGKAIVDDLGLDIHPANINKFLQKQGIGATGDVAELSIAESRRQQMDELWHGYQQSSPIVVENAPEGARVVFISDAQIPFEERWLIGGTQQRYGAMEQFIADYAPDYLFVVGDWLDNYSTSRYDKRPGRRFGLREELQATRHSLETLANAAPKAQRYFIEGNHEDRLMKTLVSVAQKDIRALELFGAISLGELTARSLLDLDGTGWQWQPYSGHVDFLGFIVTHGDVVKAESGQTASAMFQKWHSSGCSGHTHRLGSYYHTDAAGKSHVWHELGNLCRADLEYTNNPNWQQGFLIGQVSNNLVHTNLIPIFDDRFVVPGVDKYVARGV